MTINSSYSQLREKMPTMIKDNLNRVGHRLYMFASQTPDYNVDSDTNQTIDVAVQTLDTTGTILPFYQKGVPATEIIVSNETRKFEPAEIPAKTEVNIKRLQRSTRGVSQGIVNKVSNDFSISFDNFFVNTVLLGGFTTVKDDGTTTVSVLNDADFDTDPTGCTVGDGTAKMSMETVSKVEIVCSEKNWDSIFTEYYTWFVDRRSFEAFKRDTNTSVDRLGEEKINYIMNQIGILGSKPDAIMFDKLLIMPVPNNLLDITGNVVTTLLFHPACVQANIGQIISDPPYKVGTIYDEVWQYGASVAGLRENEQCVLKVKVLRAYT